MVAYVRSQWRLLRPLWRTRAIQGLLALLCLALPIVFVPAAQHEGQTELWVRAGLPRAAVKEVLLTGGAESFRYALVAGQGVYRTAEQLAATWEPADSDLPSKRWRNIRVEAIAVDPANPFVIYAGMGGAGSRDPARSAGLYMTNDAGETWQTPIGAVAGQEVQAIAVTARLASELPQTVSGESVACAATTSGIYCNTGANRSWVRLDWRGTEKVLSLAIRPDDPKVIYVGTDGFGLAVTADGGVNWRQGSVELSDRHIYDIAISPSRPDIIYLATDDGVFESADGGSTWMQMEGPIKGRRVNTIALHPSAVVSGETTLYAGLQHGAVYRSADGGRSWQDLRRGLGSLTVLSLAVDPQNPSLLWAGTTDGLWRCTLPSAAPEVMPTAIPEATPTATASSTAVPQPTATLTPTALPSATPTATSTPTVTATATLEPTPTRTVQASPTRTRTPMPSPTPTLTATPSPPPEPPGPPPTATRVLR